MKARQKRLLRAKAYGLESVPLPARTIDPAPRETSPPPSPPPPWRTARYRKATVPMALGLAMLVLWLLIKLAYVLRRSF